MIRIVIVYPLLAVLLIATFLFLGKAKRDHPRIRQPVTHLIYRLVAAIKNYESTYGLLPWGGETDLKCSEKNIMGYDKLLEILTCIPGPANYNAAVGNPRNIKFLDAPKNYTKTGYVDYWGQRFNIYLDLNYDNKVKIGNKEETGTVFVYSSGPNKKDEEGGGDDICSWKN